MQLVTSSAGSETKLSRERAVVYSSLLMFLAGSWYGIFRLVDWLASV